MAPFFGRLDTFGCIVAHRKARCFPILLLASYSRGDDRTGRSLERPILLLTYYRRDDDTGHLLETARNFQLKSSVLMRYKTITQHRSFKNFRSIFLDYIITMSKHSLRLHLKSCLPPVQHSMKVLCHNHSCLGHLQYPPTQDRQLDLTICRRPSYMKQCVLCKQSTVSSGKKDDPPWPHKAFHNLGDDVLLFLPLDHSWGLEACDTDTTLFMLGLMGHRINCLQYLV